MKLNFAYQEGKNAAVIKPLDLWNVSKDLSWSPMSVMA